MVDLCLSFEVKVLMVFGMVMGVVLVLCVIIWSLVGDVVEVVWQVECIEEVLYVLVEMCLMMLQVEFSIQNFCIIGDEQYLVDCDVVVVWCEQLLQLL